MQENETTTSKNLPKIRFVAQPENFGARIVGEIYQQITPFEWRRHDGNYDDYLCEEKAAKFEKLTNVNPHAPSYFSLTDYGFRDLKDLGCIEYVKEARIGDKLAERIADAQKRSNNNTLNTGSQEMDRR